VGPIGNVSTMRCETEAGWFQETPALSLELMALIGASGQSSVGGGASRLVDCVIARGYEDVMVLDASEGRSQLPRVLLEIRQGR
jgi:hypothetical protein